MLAVVATLVGVGAATLAAVATPVGAMLAVVATLTVVAEMPIPAAVETPTLVVAEMPIPVVVEMPTLVVAETPIPVAVETPTLVVAETPIPAAGILTIANLVPVIPKNRTPLEWMSVVRNKTHQTPVWMLANFPVVKAIMGRAIL
jgi:hypothetical protein